MDRISELPDELLVKILSLVPTKVAVSTSILSKRWEYLWMWLPKLDYGSRYCSEPKCKSLQSFLDRNLPLHRAHVIESFRLEACSLHFEPENISMWVANAVNHSVRELDILLHRRTLREPKSNKLPTNLFTCKSLVTLKVVCKIVLDVPRMVSLPSLKTLKLKSVIYFNEETLQRLLSNCPILEDLEVYLFDPNIRGKITIIVPTLQRLSLSMLHTHHTYGYVIETPSLTHLMLRDQNCNSHYCLNENMPNLIEAHVDVRSSDIRSVIGSISSVKRLAICLEAVLDEDFVFNQLEHLELCTCTRHFPIQLFRLLKASSNLQGLHLSIMKDNYNHLRLQTLEWNEPSTVPECLLLSLQSFNWLSYSGKPQARNILVYILKHALHLKTTNISSKRVAPKFEMIKELSRS